MREYSPRVLLRKIQTVHSRLYSGKRQIKFPTDERQFYMNEALSLINLMRSDLAPSYQSAQEATSKMDEIAQGLAAVERGVFGDSAKVMPDPTLEDVIKQAETIDTRLHMSDGWTFFGIWST